MIFALREGCFWEDSIKKYFGDEAEFVFFDASKFPDGEIYVRANPYYYTRKIRGQDVNIVYSLYPDTSDRLIELLFIIDSVIRFGSNSINVIIPYFPYARADSSNIKSCSVGCKVIFDMIYSAGADRLSSFDVHFDSNLLVGPSNKFYSLSFAYLISEYCIKTYTNDVVKKNIFFGRKKVEKEKYDNINSHSGVRSFSYVATDYGCAKKFNNCLSEECEKITFGKKRNYDGDVFLKHLDGDIQGKDCLIIDDILSTGNTICEVARILHEKGAKSINAFVTHPVLCSNAVEMIESSCIDHVYVYNTINVPYKSYKLVVADIVPFFNYSVI